MLLRVRRRWIEPFAVPILISQKNWSLYRYTTTFSIDGCKWRLEIVLPCPTSPSPSPSEDLPGGLPAKVGPALNNAICPLSGFGHPTTAAPFQSPGSVLRQTDHHCPASRGEFSNLMCELSPLWTPAQQMRQSQESRTYPA